MHIELEEISIKFRLTQFVVHKNLAPIDLPLVRLRGREGKRERHPLLLWCGVQQSADESISVNAMMVHQFSKRFEFRFLGDEKLKIQIELLTHRIYDCLNLIIKFDNQYLFEREIVFFFFKYSKFSNS